jgi:hypothetical protein
MIGFQKTIFANVFAPVLVVALLFLAMSNVDLTDGFLICLIASLASGPFYERRAEQLRRGKEILNRYSPERNPRPLGL